MKKIIKRISAALCAAVLMTGSSASAFADEVKKEEIILPSGMTLREFTKELEEYSDQCISGDIESTEEGSVSVGLFRGDEVIYTGYFGYTDYKENTPTDENCVYEWGSISKTLIWVSAMQLWEEGKLDLERDVREYLPEGFFQHLSYDEPITMLNLMNHNAGWCETTRAIWYTDSETIPPLKEALQCIEPAQVHRPGEVVAYSNYGAAVAGCVIECVSGMDYGEYVRQNIFEPLGLEHTSIMPDHSDDQWVYERRRQMKSVSVGGLSGYENGHQLKYAGAYPAGAATGTLADLITYGQALVSDEAPLFKSPETQQAMFTATDSYADSDVPVNMHGFFCFERGVRTYGHSGATPFGQANLEFDPETKVGAVVMQNEGLSSGWILGGVYPLVFGNLQADKYGSRQGSADFTGRHFVVSRAPHKGMLKFIPLLQTVQFTHEFDEMGGGLLQMSNGDEAAVMGVRILSDGRTLIESTSVDVVSDSFYLPKLLLFTFYLLVAVTASYMLRIRLKLRRAHRDTAVIGSALSGAGHAARFVSVLSMLSSFVIYYKYFGGIPLSAGTVIGVIQMVCGGVCAVSAAGSAVTLIKGRKSRLAFILCVLNIAANILTIAAILFYELYRFGGC